MNSAGISWSKKFSPLQVCFFYLSFFFSNKPAPEHNPPNPLDYLSPSLIFALCFATFPAWSSSLLIWISVVINLSFHLGIKSIAKILFKKKIPSSLLICVCGYMHHYTSVEVRTCGSGFSPSTAWVPGIKLRPSNFAANAFTFRSIWLDLWFLRQSLLHSPDS